MSKQLRYKAQGIKRCEIYVPWQAQQHAQYVGHKISFYSFEYGKETSVELSSDVSTAGVFSSFEENMSIVGNLTTG